MFKLNLKSRREIGKRLRQLREDNDLTIENLIDIIYDKYDVLIDEKTIRRHETGSNLPKLDKLIMFSEIYNVSLDYIVFGKLTSDDNSFTWMDTFKRLNRLINSMVLIPYKINDKNTPFCGQYIFVGCDEELQIYLNRLYTLGANSNYAFEVRGKLPYFNVIEMDKMIDDFKDYKEDLSLSEERMRKVSNNMGIDFDKYIVDKINEIVLKRK